MGVRKLHHEHKPRCMDDFNRNVFIAVFAAEDARVKCTEFPYLRRTYVRDGNILFAYAFLSAVDSTYSKLHLWLYNLG